jgi:hypothetical protein
MATAQAILEDARPELFYQVGVTPDNTETAILAHDSALQQAVSQVRKCFQALKLTWLVHDNT